MDVTQERTISGSRLVVIGVVVATLVVVGSALFGPTLRDQVRQTSAPRTLREPVASGDTQTGQVWEAVARFDGDANCLELRYLGERLDRACADPSAEEPVSSVTLTQIPDGPVVAYGVADESLRSVNVVLEAGTTITVPVKAGELGFPVGFWATALPDGERLHEVVPTADLTQ